MGLQRIGHDWAINTHTLLNRKSTPPNINKLSSRLNGLATNLTKKKKKNSSKRKNQLKK